MTIDFCDTCREFKYVRYIDKKYICKKCLSCEKVDILPIATIKEPRQELKTKPVKSSIKPRQEPKTKPVKSSIKSKKIHQEIDYTSLLGSDVYTTQALHNKFSHHCFNIRSFNNKLDRLVRSGKLFKRTVYIGGKKAYNIYSTSQENINKPHGKETHKLIYEALEEAPLTTKELCNKIGYSDRNLTKTIRTKLKNMVQIWRIENKFFYIRESEEDLKKLLQIEPKVIRVF